MTTVLRFGKTRFAIWLNDHDPPHVHVLRNDCEAKIEILTGEIVWSYGFSPGDLRTILDEIRSRRDDLMEAWHEIQGKN